MNFNGDAAVLRRLLAGLDREDEAAALPLLWDTAALLEGRASGCMAARLERRYARICFIQQELGRLDFSRAKPGEGFDDFVFGQTDFSVYNKIGEAEFRLFYLEGPADYGDAFFVKSCGVSRAAALGALRNNYRKLGPFYYSRRKELNPLLLAVMRNLKTSLDFLPLLGRKELDLELTSLRRLHARRLEPAAGPVLNAADRFFAALIRCLHGVRFIHRDGMETLLTVSGGQDNGMVLSGAFHPAGKAYTIALARSGPEPGTGPGKAERPGGALHGG